MQPRHLSFLHLFNVVRDTIPRLSLALAVLTGLAGCATQPPTNTHSSVISKPSAFEENLEATGRLSVNYERNGHEESVHAGFAWSQKGQTLSIILRSPLGQTMATLNASPGIATLQQAGEPMQQASDLDQLAAQTLGWPLPIAGLRDWLQGYVRTQDGTRVAVDPQLEQSIKTSDGWNLKYSDWQIVGTKQTHPKRMDLARTSSEAGPVALRIVIDSWQ